MGGGLPQKGRCQPPSCCSPPAPQECRVLKNFSSLYAILSALQSNSIHRLKKTWEEVSRWAGRGAGPASVSLRPAVLPQDSVSHSVRPWTEPHKSQNWSPQSRSVELGPGPG